ncbi:MAG: hypothetical protein ABJG68_17395 [Crocinitomicaceae bacterium]
MGFIIILVTSALFALVQIFKTKNIFARVLNAVFAISIGLCIVKNPVIAIDGYYLLGMAGLLTIFYVIHNEEFALQKRIILGVMALIHLLAIGAFVMHWPSKMYFFLLGIVPLLLFLYTLIKDVKSYKDEIGFMTVMSAVGLVNFISVLMMLLAD